MLIKGADMEAVPELREENECMDLPPGFRFHPTDEEIITHYLSNKVLNQNFSARAMGEVDLNRSEPWDLPSNLLPQSCLCISSSSFFFPNLSCPCFL